MIFCIGCIYEPRILAKPKLVFLYYISFYLLFTNKNALSVGNSDQYHFPVSVYNVQIRIQVVDYVTALNSTSADCSVARCRNNKKSEDSIGNSMVF